MNNLLRILTVQSVRELVKFKSFFLLVFLLLVANKVVRTYVSTDSLRNWITLNGENWAMDAATFVFEQLPGELAARLADPLVLITLVGLFFVKQIISIWPSSDMRRMHRRERGRFGILEAAAAIRWDQVVWDAIAVATLCGVLLGWGLLSYGIGLAVWHWQPTPAALAITAGLGCLSTPVALAGFSYSSKLAVLRQGKFREKLTLFFRLFFDPKIFWPSWLFFTARIIVEALFVAIIPVGAILLIPNFWLRMAVAAGSATPVYSYIKMASFKFFLEIYGRFDLVQSEYADYYRSKADDPQQ